MLKFHIVYEFYAIFSVYEYLRIYERKHEKYQLLLRVPIFSCLHRTESEIGKFYHDLFRLSNNIV